MKKPKYVLLAVKVICLDMNAYPGKQFKTCTLSSPTLTTADENDLALAVLLTRISRNDNCIVFLLVTVIVTLVPDVTLCG